MAGTQMLEKRREKLEKKRENLELKRIKAVKAEHERAELVAVKEQKRLEKKRKKTTMKNIEEADDDLFDEKNRNAKDLVAANGVNPCPLEYMEINDGGQKLYVMVMYVHKLPKTTTFGVTFPALFNFPNVTSSVHVEPVSKGRATKKLDKQVMGIESEEDAAQNQHDSNRYRRMNRKRVDKERWATEVEGDMNRLYEVSFFFGLYDKTIDGLNIKATDFMLKAREKGIDLMSCYSEHPEAFLSLEPTNGTFKLMKGPIGVNIGKKHILDKRSLAHIFNHTNTGFRHKNGVFAGYNLDTGYPFMWDPYDRSHNGYGVVYAGQTGTGKSATVKEMLTRKVDFGAKGVIIDCDAVGSIGEYVLTAYREGGTVYQMGAKSKNILNPYELDEEMDYDETTDTEWRTLDLNGKLSDLRNIMLTMVTGGKQFGAKDEQFMEEIITNINRALYNERGIRDGEPDSLYTTGTVYRDGRLVSGQVKKTLPTIHDFYIKLLKERRANRLKNHIDAYDIIVAAMRENYVRELYICNDTFKEFSKEEYEKLPINKYGVRYYSDGKSEHEVSEVKGITPYYDGQSTIKYNRDTPVFDIDLSQIKDEDKPVAQMVALSFVTENILKKNSINPHKTAEVILILDEAHRLFKYAKSLEFLESNYRTARKRHISPWTITQSIRDFELNAQTKTIFNQSVTKFLFKHEPGDRKFIAEVTPLNEGQIDRLLTLGGDPDDKEASDARRGEVCLIDNRKIAFIKMVYLKKTEAEFVETDAVNRKKLFEAMGREVA